MTTAAANKLLKIIEEPPQKTLFLLVTEREDLLLQTITSRCQLVKIPRLSQSDVKDYLIENKNQSPEKAQHIVAEQAEDFKVDMKIAKQLRNVADENGNFTANAKSGRNINI